MIGMDKALIPTNISWGQPTDPFDEQELLEEERIFQETVNEVL